MGSLSLFDITEQYCKQTDLRPLSCEQYKRIVRIFEKDRGRKSDIRLITKNEMLEWRKMLLLRVKRVSCNHYLRHLKVIFNYAISQQIITHNPCSKIFVRQPIKPKKTVNATNIQQAFKLLSTPSDENDDIYPKWFWRTVFNTFYTTGMRLGQLLALQWQDINLNTSEIILRSESSKTHREWIIPITKTLHGDLSELKQKTVKKLARSPISTEQVFNISLFSHKYQTPKMTRWQVISFFQDLSKYTDCRISSHRLRHTLATELMKEPDRNLALVKTLLGHSNVRTTLEYVTIDNGLLKTLLEQRETHL